MNRKIWTAEEKLQVVLAMLRSEAAMTEVCHRHQVSATQAYRWRDAFLEGGKKTLVDTRTKKGQDPVLNENRRLKKLVGSLSLIIDVQKKLVGH
jgi:transposase-like protein